jgi:hypothetical protein
MPRSAGTLARLRLKAMVKVMMVVIVMVVMIGGWTDVRIEKIRDSSTENAKARDERCYQRETKLEGAHVDG